MSGRVVQRDTSTHQAVQEVLPWYASSQLPANEAQLVEQHLLHCEQCRDDLQWEREMHAVGQADALLDVPVPGVDVERAWARMMAALGSQDAVTMAAKATAAEDETADEPLASTGPRQRLTTQRWWQTGAANQPSWLRWAMAAQWVLIVGLVALLVRPDQSPAAYRVLGNGVSGTSNLVVMFQPNTTERELRRILQAQGARVVDGPTVTDAYLLNVPDENRDRALRALRSDPAVKLAEALDDSAAP